MNEGQVHSTAPGAEAPSLAQLADLALPPPVPWTPQTVGWAVLGVLAVAVALGFAWRWWRHWRANRYRRDALTELARWEVVLAQANLAQDAAARLRVLAALPPLLKRTALAAWPREEVAALSGACWSRFLGAAAGDAVTVAAAATRLAPLVDAAEYRGEVALARYSGQEAGALLQAARQWIEGHRGPA